MPDSVDGTLRWPRNQAIWHGKFPSPGATAGLIHDCSVCDDLSYKIARLEGPLHPMLRRDYCGVKNMEHDGRTRLQPSATIVARNLDGRNTWNSLLVLTQFVCFVPNAAIFASGP